MDETILSWTPENMVTVLLMAVIGFAVLRVIFTWLGNRSGA
jgi:hypothetical protein